MNFSVKRWCDFGANLVQHFMLAYSQYQTLLSKLEEIIIISYIQKLCSRRAFCFCMAVQFVKNPAVHIIKRSESASSLVSERVRLNCERFAKSKTSAQHRLAKGEVRKEYLLFEDFMV